MIIKENIKIGKKVAYAPFIDEDGNADSVLIECTITDGPFEMCGTTCCFVDRIKSCVAIDNLFEI